MTKLVCKAIELKSDKFLNRNEPTQSMICEKCVISSFEDGEHIVMHCQYLHSMRVSMLDDIANFENAHSISIVNNQCNLFLILMGKPIDNIDFETLAKFLMLVARHMHSMYITVTKCREGIG